MILILTYAILVYLVTERRRSWTTSTRTSERQDRGVPDPRVRLHGGPAHHRPGLGRRGGAARRIFHAALQSLGGKRIARPSFPIRLRGVRRRDRPVRGVVRAGYVARLRDLQHPDEERLDSLLDLIRKPAGRRGVRGPRLCARRGLPHLSPLIIGGEDLLIGVDDPATTGRVRRCTCAAAIPSGWRPSISIPCGTIRHPGVETKPVWTGTRSTPCGRSSPPPIARGAPLPPLEGGDSLRRAWRARRSPRLSRGLVTFGGLPEELLGDA